MRILVLGAGAVGGIFGGLLHSSGVDVTFLVRPERKRQLDQQGLWLKIPTSKQKLNIKTLTADALCTSYDLIILANKAYSLDSVINDITPAVGPDTYILPLLNGVKHLELLDQFFGQEKVLGGIAKTIATLEKENVVNIFNGRCSISIGVRKACQQPIIDTLAVTLCNTGIDFEFRDDIASAMWDKFARMAALGAANCLLQGTVGQYMQSEQGGNIATRIFKECTDTSEHHGYPLSSKAIQSFNQALTSTDSTFNSSMYRDMNNGLPIEGEHLVGDMLNKAKHAGIDCPLLTIANAVLQTYSAKQVLNSC